MRIRKAKKSDAKEISKLRINTLKKINSKDYSKEQIAALIKSNKVNDTIRRMNDRDMFCLLMDNKIIGVVDLKVNRIGGFYIKSNLINKGYGKIMLDFIENHARKKGIKKLILFPSKYAEKFYKKYGYKIVKSNKRYNTILINNVEFKWIKMEKKI